MIANRELTDGEMLLCERIRDDAEAAAMCVEEGRMASAFEHLYVAQTTARVAMHVEQGELTKPQAILIGKVAWASAGLLMGNFDRIYDDLEAIEAVADDVQN